jgi:hypothetical protein
MNQAIEAVEQVIIGGDLADLNQGERLKYVTALCESMGLNPLTKPFEFLKLQGRTVLYARKDCADQLRKIHGVSIRVIDKEEIDGLYIVTVQAQDRNGRADEDMGAVAIAGLRGENKANAIAKAITKAKRRVTLSICGLGIIDETEADDIPHASPVVWQPDSPTKAIEGPSGAEEPRGATKMPEEAEAAPLPSDGLAGGFLLSFPQEYLDGKELKPETPILFATEDDWMNEYISQMASIMNDVEISPRERMHLLKLFEETNEPSFKIISKDLAKNLKARRLKANKKLGPLK